MPVRVNTKFVFVLFGVVAVLVAALAAWYLLFLRTDPAENVYKAEQYFAQGEYSRATEYMGKAVFKRQNDVELLRRYAEMLDRAEVDQLPEARRRVQLMVNIRREMSEARPGDPELLENFYRYLFHLAVEQRLGASYLNFLGDLAETGLSGATDESVAAVARTWRSIAGIYDMGLDTPPADSRQVFEELAAALERDPDNALAAHHLARWNLLEASRLINRQAPETEVQGLRDLAVEVSQGTLAESLDETALPTLLRHAQVLSVDEVERPEELREVVAAIERRMLDTPEPGWAVVPTVSMLLRGSVSETEPGIEQPDLDEVESGMDRAVALLERAIEAHPREVQFRVTLARLLQSQGEIDPALAINREAIEVPREALPIQFLRNHQFRPQAQIAVGELLLAQAEQAEGEERERLLSEAESVIDRLKAEQSETAALNLLEGKLLLTRGDYAKALNRLDRASSQTNRRNTEALRLVAVASERLGQWGNAREQLERLLELRPGNAAIMLSLAEAMIRSQDFTAAQDMLSRVAEVAPDDPRVARLRATLMAATGDAEGAIAELEAASPEAREQAATLLARLYAQAGRGEQAHALAVEQYEAEPENVRLLRLALATTEDQDRRLALIDRAAEAGVSASVVDLLRQQITGEGESVSVLDATQAAIAEIEDPDVRGISEVRLLLAQGEREQAAARLDAMLDESPDLEAALELRFEMALADEDFETARRIADRARVLDLDDARGGFYEGRLAAAQRDWDRAVVAFRKAVRLRPVYSEGWTLLGQAHARAGEYQAAAQALERAVEQRPDNVEALLMLGQSYSRLDDAGRARAAFAQAYRFSPRDRRVFEAFVFHLAANDEQDRAIELRRNRAEQFPGDTDNRRSLAVVLAARGDIDAAMAEMDQVVEEQGLTTANAATLARLHSMTGDEEAALAVLRQLVAERGADAEPREHMLVAAQLINLGRFDEAQASYEAALAADDGASTTIQRQMADMLFAAGEIARSVAIYREVHQQEPDDAAVRLRLAEALLRLDQSEQALTLLEDQADPSVSELLLRATIAGRQGETDRAIELLDRAVGTAPDHRQARLMRAQMVAASDARAEQPVTDLTRVLTDNPGDVAARRTLAILRQNRGEIEPAIREFRTLLTQDPTDATSRARLVLLLRRAGRTLEALDVAQEGLRREPERAGWAQSVGELARQAGRLDVAVEAFARAVELDATTASVAGQADALIAAERPGEALAALEAHPNLLSNSPRLQALRGRALFLEGRADAAEQVFARALERSGDINTLEYVARQAVSVFEVSGTMALMQASPRADDAAFLVVMGQLALGAQRWGEAADYFERAVAEVSDPDTVAMLLPSLATAQHQAGRTEAAAQSYRRAIEGRPDNAQLLNNYAFLLANELNRAEEAIEFAREANAVRPNDPYITDTLGWVQHLAGESAAALATLRRSVAIQPLPANLYHLGKTLADTGDTTEARRYLTQSLELAESTQDSDFREKARGALEALPETAAP